MKILIIPDVHGRDFWVEPCTSPEKYDKIVFLGDYHDPYPFQVSQEDSLGRLQDALVPFVEKNREKTVCLFGNHDGNYLADRMADRLDFKNAEKVRAALQRMRLRLTFEADGFLFSHSGVLPEWLERRGLELRDLEKMPFSHPALKDVSPYRFGGAKCGSCVWGDVVEYFASKKLAGFYQIFGHTQQEKYPVIEKDFACLDCRRCFVLDTKAGLLESWRED